MFLTFSLDYSRDTNYNTSTLHCSQDLINWYSIFPSHQLFRASQMFGFNRAIDRIKFYCLFHWVVWFLYQSAHFWNGVSWAWARWCQCAFWILFYGRRNFLIYFPFCKYVREDVQVLWTTLFISTIPSLDNLGGSISSQGKFWTF